jgi:2-oxoglutarate ferredoxin oxidoreductase subunit alpha
MTAKGDETAAISIALTGSGGAGVITAGNMLLEAAAKAGCYGLFTRSSGPQIRGGEAAAMIRLANEPVAAPGDVFDILVALDWHNIDRFAVELPLAEGSLVVADPSQGEVPEVITASGARIAELPMKELAKAVAKGRPNMIALGVIAGLVGLSTEVAEEVMARTLEKRGDEVLAASREAFAAGVEAARAMSFDGPDLWARSGIRERWIISGNEAAGLGAVRGGIRFVAAYPITPATDLLEWMAPNLQRLGGALVQAEDELASINMIIGASYGGTPALTATSGPGLALMSESLGLAVASEVPFVVVDVMRGGPSTGIPTKSEQGDLNIALFGLHGDAPHLVLAPTSVGDCVFTTQWAVSLAEALQTPAIVLSDQALGQTRAIIDRPADIAFVSQRVTAGAAAVDDYQRYALAGAHAGGGVSPMAIPGTPGRQYTADGLEHGESGLPSSHASDHVSQLDKRAAKLEGFDYGNHWAEIEGDGRLAVVTWGSSAGAVRGALARLRSCGHEFRLISPRLLAPAQPARWAEALNGVERVLVVELNHSAQFYRYLKGYCDLPCPVDVYHRPGPQPLRVGELAAKIEEWSGS